MKTLSLKLDDGIFEETDNITGQLNIPRNRYINEALSMFNAYNKRKLLKEQLKKESKKAMKDSLEVMHEFEMLEDENQAV